MVKFGYHIYNIEGVREGHNLGLRAFQIFPGHNVFKIIRKYSSDAISEWKSLIQDLDLQIVFHAAYSATLTSPMNVREKTKDYIQNVLDLAAKMSFSGVVIHAGSGKVRDGARDLAESMLDSLTIPENTPLLLESMASKADLLNGFSDLLKERPGIKYCIDTEHISANGVDLREESVRESKFAAMNGKVGLIHLNNIPASFEIGCGRDIHEFLHKGLVPGLTLVKWASRFNVPMICERSGFSTSDMTDFSEEISMIRAGLES